jgi:hypothetical protein
MFSSGDLVKVVDGWYLHYFQDKIGIVVSEALEDYFDEGADPYYQVLYPNEGHHMMLASDLQLVSKAAKNNEIQGV